MTAPREAEPPSVLLFPDNAPVRGHVPERLLETPIVLDTDIGGDPDDAVALVAAARGFPQLSLVLTTDETARPPGGRAHFARGLLREMGRPDVAVAAGASSGDPGYFFVDGIVDRDASGGWMSAARSASPIPGTGDVVAAVRSLCARTTGPIRWVGMGPMTNLARVIVEAPELAGCLRLTQMGGQLHPRGAKLVEHNIGSDAPAARAVLAAVASGQLPTPRFVSADVTFDPGVAVTPDSELYQLLASPDGPPWATMVAAHLDQWFTGVAPQTHMHDPLALSAALALPFVATALIPIVIDETGRVRRSADGVAVRWSVQVEARPFMTWLASQINPATPVSPVPHQ